MILNKLGVKKTYTLEVQPLNSATQTTWQFPDIPFLREKYISGVSLSVQQYGTVSGKSNIGYLISQTNQYSFFLTLVNNKGTQFIQNIPLDELITIGLQSNNQVASINNYIYSSNTNSNFVFNPINIVWTKSYLYTPVAFGVSDYVAQFNIIYQDQK